MVVEGGSSVTDFSDSWRGVGKRSGDFSVGRGGNDGLGNGGFLVNDSVETVHWVGGVLDGTDGTVRLDEGVATLNDITVTGFVLALGVTGKSVFDVIGVRVLWVRVVLVGDDGFGGDGGGGSVGDGVSGVGLSVGGGSGVGDGVSRVGEGRRYFSVGWCAVSEGGARSNNGGGAEESGLSGGHEGGDDDEL